MPIITFIDIETDACGKKVLDIGGFRSDGATFHGANIAGFVDFLHGSDYVCGHNILNHDLKFAGTWLMNAGVKQENVIDTLYLSPLLFPRKPYHALLKDDKLQTDELNNPLNDSIKARDLFNDEVSAFIRLDDEIKRIYLRLTGAAREFRAFFEYLRESEVLEEQSSSLFSRLFQAFSSRGELSDLIFRRFAGKICENADIDRMIDETPVALGYSLAFIDILGKDGTDRSITPPWVLKNYPEVEQIVFKLRSVPCLRGCRYCEKAWDVRSGLKRWFGFDNFRTYNGEPLQEKAVASAVENKSLLAVFPTGGGKSLAFQLPALMSGENTGSLTVVISPLQSLMKDQVDSLEGKGITEAVTINGLLDPVERAKSFERVESGAASILYISPESLRSRSIERMILKRKISRFVIDEAHCFSSWGQDFRVDYLYIADFIKSIQQKKCLPESIPVSCFTATAKPQVIEDIRSYFKNCLQLDLELFVTAATRPNLHYTVLPERNDETKYQSLRRLLESHDCPTIVYVTRTRKAEDIATRLASDGFEARPYHGKMPTERKIENQNAFMSGEARIIVATSASGMGVDKSDVGLVIHYEISDSLENYVQEAGRAGRDAGIEADCYVLYNEEDLSKHFLLLNQTKMTLKEIQQVWKAIKDLTRYRSKVSNSALEIARLAGWDDNVADIETRVRTAIASLERAGYLKRGQNMPRVYATGILARNAQEAIDRINASSKFDDKQKIQAIRIIKNLIASKNRRSSPSDEAESRVDYISDRLGISREDVIHVVNLLREVHILADSKDLTIYFGKGDTMTRPLHVLNMYSEVENFIAQFIGEQPMVLDLKKLNEAASSQGKTSVDLKKLKIVLNFWAIKGWIRKSSLRGNANLYDVSLMSVVPAFLEKVRLRQELSKFIVKYLFALAHSDSSASDIGTGYLEFSEYEIKSAYEGSLAAFSRSLSIDDVEDALFWLSRIEAIRIEGGFLVVYNTMTIERLELDNKKRFKTEDYQSLSRYYENRIQQIHIVGEYAKKMIDDYKEALQFVDDYFQMNYAWFLDKYFKRRRKEISVNITPAKFRQIFGDLSPAQLKIINDRTAKYIVVAAGPGSGKTKLLVHKLASLLMMEDVRHEQLLMLTFSRAAATEFKLRLYGLIGNAAAFVEIKTFHSYSFDLLGRMGSLERSEGIVRTAVDKIAAGEVDVSRITKTVLVIDEAQDMDEDEFELVKALMRNNEEMRVIAVGDDDQNIYEFRGSSSRYMEKFLNVDGASKYELVDNYRSAGVLVEFANRLASTISCRLKDLPVAPVRKEQGGLRIVRHYGNHIETPVVDEILSMRLNGSTAVLTKTNKEAIGVVGLLVKAGLAAKLIQNDDSFNLKNLAEVRYFMRALRPQCAVIDEEDWENAKRALYEEYRRSDKLEICHKLLKAFESVNPKIKYMSDFETFVAESALEDFIDADASTVFVSTIHKVKGKEFDNVYLMLENFIPGTDEEKRQLYVAVTRAKNNLSIHLNSAWLDPYRVEGAEYVVDRKDYAQPSEMTLPLSLRDVWLDDCIHYQKSLGELRSGDELVVKDEALMRVGGEVVVRFSRSFRDKYNLLKSKGYALYRAEVDFLVWWKGQDKTDEILVPLPKVYLKKLSPFL